ncbi:MAG: ATPase, partial [Bacteroidales bacterium]|nr:ATPase [Bacteroidales bacterium]
FMMFFGFCMVDAVYCLLFVLAGFLLRAKVKPDFRPILSLVCYLGAAAVVFGMLSGTFFGVSLVNVPSLQRFHAYILGQDQLMMLSLALGGIQILFGMFVHVLNIARQKGFKYAVGALGWWLILVFAIPLLAEQMTAMTLPVAVRYACYAFVGIGACGAFFYNSPGKPIWMNFGSGLWASYNTATGLVGDLLSYIRLFALGLTGGILGGVFNDLALQMSGSIPVLKQLIMILILLFGHGLNIALCALGSVVHPLRLTFVEFYKNAGFAGGGRAYQAFKIEE